MSERTNALPVIHVKGTHYEVGYKVGLTFKSMIKDLIENFSYLTGDLIPLYQSETGRKIYEESLAAVESAFPQYIEEIKGLANGADVPFFKLFLLHLDMVLLANADKNFQALGSTGCSTILCNHQNNQLIGHNEDALVGIENKCYVVCAEILEPTPRGKWKVQSERFASMCYAGHLPGFCMSWNKYGLAYSVNIVVPNEMYSGKIPRHFLCRSLLAAQNMEDFLRILKDTGDGIADGVSLNLGFMAREREPILYNIEVGPLKDKAESVYSVHAVNLNETYLHCNVYKHLNTPVKKESCLTSSDHREMVYKECKQPNDTKSVLAILGNRSDKEYPIFRDAGAKDVALTVHTGIFDFKQQTWAIYNENPATAKQPLYKLSWKDL